MAEDYEWPSGYDPHSGYCAGYFWTMARTSHPFRPFVSYYNWETPSLFDMYRNSRLVRTCLRYRATKDPEVLESLYLQFRGIVDVENHVFSFRPRYVDILRQQRRLPDHLMPPDSEYVPRRTFGAPLSALEQLRPDLVRKVPMPDSG
eukprot:TRINITY_DN24872_c0_g1_i1.p1 TRINITY_DN24872_c0_g1~~TRINITY_DN24872_c0_g1_i1.p1  ORF type:complete len:147 (-),score=5.37 TRINITY_DN24872_c0_g1_i1:88-528(-)